MQFGAPRGRYRLRVLEGIQVRLLGVAGVSPVAGVGERLCPLLPRPVGPVEGAPGQQHVPD